MILDLIMHILKLLIPKLIPGWLHKIPELIIPLRKKPSSKNEGRRLRGVDQSLSKGKVHHPVFLCAPACPSFADHCSILVKRLLEMHFLVSLQSSFLPHVQEQETHDLDAMSSSDEEEDDFNEEENDFESELEEDEETSDEEDNEGLLENRGIIFQEKGQTMTAMLATGMGEDDLEAEKKKIEDELKEIQIEEKLGEIHH